MGWDTDNWSWVVWPDADNGPLWVGVQWRRMDGRWECIGLRVEFAPGARVRPLTTNDLRGLALGKLLEAAGEELAQSLLEEHGDPWGDPTQEGSYAQFIGRVIDAAPKQVGGRSLQEVARIYNEALQAGSPPRLAVAKAFNLKPGTAAKLIHECRKAGWLPQTKQGRARGSQRKEEKE